jgi:hypothetical protein
LLAGRNVPSMSVISSTFEISSNKIYHRYSYLIHHSGVSSPSVIIRPVL